MFKWFSIIIFAGAALWFIFRLDAKANKHDKAMEQIAKIANNMTAPHFILRNYLLLHQIDTLTSDVWSKYHQDAPMDSKDTYLLNIHFLAKKTLPKLGLLSILKSEGDTVKIFMLDTLWDFR